MQSRTVVSVQVSSARARQSVAMRCSEREKHRLYSGRSKPSWHDDTAVSVVQVRRAAQMRAVLRQGQREPYSDSDDGRVVWCEHAHGVSPEGFARSLRSSAGAGRGATLLALDVDHVMS